MNAPRLLDGYDERLGSAEVALLPVGVQSALVTEAARLLGLLQEGVIEPYCKDLYDVSPPEAHRLPPRPRLCHTPLLDPAALDSAMRYAPDDGAPRRSAEAEAARAWVERGPAHVVLDTPVSGHGPVLAAPHLAGAVQAQVSELVAPGDPKLPGGGGPGAPPAAPVDVEVDEDGYGSRIGSPQKRAIDWAARVEAAAFVEDARRAEADARVADAPTAEQAEAHALVLRCVEGLLHGLELSLPQLLQAFRDALGRVLAKVRAVAFVRGLPPPRAVLYHLPEVAPPSYLAELDPGGGDDFYVASLGVGAASASAAAAATTQRLVGPPPPLWEPSSEPRLSAPAAVLLSLEDACEVDEAVAPPLPPAVGGEISLSGRGGDDGDDGDGGDGGGGGGGGAGGAGTTARLLAVAEAPNDARRLCVPIVGVNQRTMAVLELTYPRGAPPTFEHACVRRLARAVGAAVLRAQQRTARRARREAAERQAAANGRAHAAAERACARQAALLRTAAEALAAMRYSGIDPAATCARLAAALRTFAGAEAVVIFGAAYVPEAQPAAAAFAAAFGSPAAAELRLEPLHNDLAPQIAEVVRQRVARQAAQRQAASKSMKKRGKPRAGVAPPAEDEAPSVPAPELPHRGLARAAAAAHAPVLSADAYAEPPERFEPGAEAEAAWRTGSVLAVPLVHEGVVLGVVQLLNKTAPAGEAAVGEAEAEEAEVGPVPTAVSLFGGDGDGDGHGDGDGGGGGGGGGGGDGGSDGGGGGDGGYDGGGDEEEAGAAAVSVAALAAPRATFAIVDADAVGAVGATLALVLLRWREEHPKPTPTPTPHPTPHPNPNPNPKPNPNQARGAAAPPGGDARSRKEPPAQLGWAHRRPPARRRRAGVGAGLEAAGLSTGWRRRRRQRWHPRGCHFAGKGARRSARNLARPQRGADAARAAVRRAARRGRAGARAAGRHLLDGGGRWQRADRALPAGRAGHEGQEWARGAPATEEQPEHRPRRGGARAALRRRREGRQRSGRQPLQRGGGPRARLHCREPHLRAGALGARQAHRRRHARQQAVKPAGAH